MFLGLFPADRVSQVTYLPPIPEPFTRSTQSTLDLMTSTKPMVVPANHSDPAPNPAAETLEFTIKRRDCPRRSSATLRSPSRSLDRRVPMTATTNKSWICNAPLEVFAPPVTIQPAAMTIAFKMQNGLNRRNDVHQGHCRDGRRCIAVNDNSSSQSIALR
jgi:hypothetical protein